MHLSFLDIFKIGLGPSSSHVTGPMVAARRFLEDLDADLLAATARVSVELFGSLASTGRGHGTDDALVMGLLGLQPDSVEPEERRKALDAVARTGRLALLGKQGIAFDRARDIVFRVGQDLPLHPNGMLFQAFAEGGAQLAAATWYSVGGGFVASAGELAQPGARTSPPVPLPFGSAAELLAQASKHGLSIAGVVLRNEDARRPRADTLEALARIRRVMAECIDRGLAADGTLPGGLAVKRRAGGLYRKLRERGGASLPHAIMDWISLYAIAVNEENAAGNRVVTAPTNGAAGIVPAVLRYYSAHCPGASDEMADTLLLTAAAIGMLYKTNASISGAEVGCQGEVGVASSMAAGGLAAALGGSNAQIENAAEIAMEHHLGLTCDPVRGLVQIPCIERNAIGAVKAIAAASLALDGDGSHRVSLDAVIATMNQTGRDMLAKYRETSTGGLAVMFTKC